MAATLIVTPNPATVSTVVNIAGAGFPNYKTRLSLDGEGTSTNIFRPRKDGTFNVGITVGSKAKTQTLIAQNYVASSWKEIARTSITVQAIVVTPPPDPDPPPDDPPPPDPPSAGNFYIYGGSVPTGPSVKTFNGSNSSSLAGFLAALNPGETGILAWDGDHVENVTVTMKSNTTVLPAPGARPWLRGNLILRGGTNVKFYGLSNHYPEVSSSGHMITESAGDGIDFGYAEIKDAPCYTLIHPADTLINSRFHHLWVHDNHGVSSHDGNQDHGFYASATNASQNLRIDHCLIEVMPRGRNIKVGGASSGGAIGGITIDKCTLRLGYGPSNLQFSNGARDNVATNNVFIDSGKSTSITEGSSCGPNNVYSGNWADRTVGPNTSNVHDGGGNVVKSASVLLDYAANGAAGKGHLAS